MAKTYLMLGSNLGDRMAYLELGVRALPGPIKCSKVYETDPVDSPEGSRPFLNAAVELVFDADVARLYCLVSTVEALAGRERGEVNGPRTLDVDVVYVEGFSSSDPLMTIPHPRAFQRAFVIAPISDLSPGLASRLNPEIALKISIAKKSGLSVVYPGVALFQGPLC